MIAELHKELENPYPEGFRFIPVDMREIDEESDLFYTTEEDEEEDEDKLDYLKSGEDS